MIEKMLLSIKKLPPFPAAARKVAELLRNDDYSVGEVANVIKYDQAIAANILKICNSAYFGARQRISSIPEAVIYLGQKQLLRAVETASAGRIFARGNPGYGIKPKDLWRHSVAVALMSQILSRRLANKENPALYTAALLHDVGKLILGTFVEGSYRRITEVMAERACSFLEAEEEVLGINHAELGGRIAVYWNFPAEIHDAIAFHHRPDLMAAGETTLANLVYLADQFCLLMGIDGGCDQLAHRGLEEVMKRYHIKEGDIEESILRLKEEIERAQELLEIA